MSLLKLLTTGKSLDGAKDLGSRYRMTNRRLLPKFGTARNPFQADAAPAAPAQAEVAAPVQAQAVETPAEPMAPVAAQLAKPAVAQSPKAAPSLLQLGTSKARGLASALQSRWSSQLGSLLSKPARKPKLIFSAPVKATAPVQGELSLDRVKVVRNDLRDADLEVVPVKSRPAAAAAPAEPKHDAALRAQPGRVAAVLETANR
jgi:hypothetical protein